METRKPIHEIRLGRIRASIWPPKNGGSLQVTVSRLYKRDDQKWASSDSFLRDDLLVVSKVADLANTWIFENAKKLGSDEDQQSE